MFFLSSVNTYINSASIVIFLLWFSSLRCGRYNSVCMFFHLQSIHPTNKVHVHYVNVAKINNTAYVYKAYQA